MKFKIQNPINFLIINFKERNSRLRYKKYTYNFDV